MLENAKYATQAWPHNIARFIPMDKTCLYAVNADCLQKTDINWTELKTFLVVTDMSTKGKILPFR